MRKLALAVVLCLLAAPLTGCWSYRSLNDMSIVVGMGIDHTPGQNYQITAEMVDLSGSVKQSGPKSKVIEAEGKSIFDAIRNAKDHLANRLYFGNMNLIVLGETLAREDGISDTIDWILRESEARETINLVISKADTARSLLTVKGTDQNLLSTEMEGIIMENNYTTSSTSHMELYTAYNILHCQGDSLTLPAFTIVKNGEERTAQADGIATFQADKLIGFLTPEQSKTFLLATGQARGGVFTLSLSGNGPDDVALEILEDKASIRYTQEGGRLAMIVETQTTGALAEAMADIDVLDESQLKALELRAAETLKGRILDLLQTIQADQKTDIFGFGHYIHQYNHVLWMSLNTEWNTLFPTLPIEVHCAFKIRNSSYIKSSEVLSG